MNTTSSETEAVAQQLRKQLNEKQTKLQKELADIHNKQLELDNALFDLRLTHSTSDNFGLSSILTKADKISLTKLCHFPLSTKWNLIYRANDDGFSAKSFHNKCDHVKGILVIYKNTLSPLLTCWL